MVVASGQMPYNYGTSLPIRAPSGAWPGIVVPNIGASGDIIEAAMFVYNSELRKWDADELSSLVYNLYTHPDITPSGFEPKPRGETLTGLVTNTAGLMSINNLEHLRTQLLTFLFDLYSEDSDYSANDFLEAWLKTAYPEHPSGNVVVHAIIPNSLYSIGGQQFLRPPAEHITNANFIDIDPHWLGGSGVLFDVDAGEVVFNPFPFPHARAFFSPAGGLFRFVFTPVIPLVQTTLGAIPSINASRYKSDISTGTFKSTTNFDALASGYVQIDGYVLLPETLMELVKGNDNNFGSTVSFANDYTDHIQGLRRVAGLLGKNDASARCYRLPTPQSSGLYRLLTHNPKSLVPHTAIASGFVSLWPQGRVILASDNTQRLDNFIDGQQLTEKSDGTFTLSPTQSRGVHVLDDAIWITTKNDSDGSGTFTTAGLYPVSPYTGELLWYRPAERLVSTSGNFGPGPAIFGAHVGLMDLGSNFVRVSKTCLQIFESNVVGSQDRNTVTLYFQQYNKTTLDCTEFPVGYAVQSEDANTGSFGGSTGLHGAVTDGSFVYVWTEFGTVHKFSTGLSFDTAYRGPIARRRHYANGQLLYTIGANIQVGDPLLSIAGGGITSGIGVWSLTDPAGTTVDSVGIVNHDSAKPLNGEVHFGHQDRARIHTIFDVTGATHVRNGTWMLIQFTTVLYLARIIERPSDWLVVESIRLVDTIDTILAGSVPDAFPIECILHDID